ncbi:MAG: DUF5009 domain-containing protein [Chthoniobacteraceae bacterium]
MPDASTAIPPKPQRIASVDAYRGFVMFLMMAEVLRIAKVAAGFPESGVWQVLKFHTSHVEWTGCSLHDLIQPSFSFLVGVALPFSIAARAAKGQSGGVMTLHACWRAVALVLLGVFLRSVGKAETNWTFEDTLSQIGLGYAFLFALGFTPRRVQWGGVRRDRGGLLRCMGAVAGGSGGLRLRESWGERRVAEGARAVGLHGALAEECEPRL